MDFDEPQLAEMESGVTDGGSGPKNIWLGRIGLVLLSTALSSAISVTAVSIGWKASIDTLNAVSQVKIAEHEDRLNKLDLQTVKLSDLVYRDQLLDSKLALLNLELAGLKDQIAELDAHKGH